MRKFQIALLFSLLLFLVTLTTPTLFAEDGERRISVEDYRDKMAGGWLGQMAGVGWGLPTEFKFNGVMVPEERVPKWQGRMINMQNNDDLYVEMTFLRTLEEYGLGVSQKQAGIDFGNSGYRLWHANKAGRENVRNGLEAPNTGHPYFNSHADDIDYQIEADYSGLISPGMPNSVIKLGDTFGRIMNYGDGLYGGLFVGAMYSEAFFEDDVEKIIAAGLAAVPEESQFTECIRDTLKWWKENPDDWQATWKLIDAKYQKNPDYRRFSCKGMSSFNIDAKINAAYIVMGMVYGWDSFDDVIITSMRCGADSDCNPSNAAGVLGTVVGMKKFPKNLLKELDRKKKFSHTAYNFDELLEVCEKLARDVVKAQGGRVEKGADGKEYFIIPTTKKLNVPPLEQCWEPGPIYCKKLAESERGKEAKARFEARMSKPANQRGGAKPANKMSFGQKVLKAPSEGVKVIAPGWTLKDNGPGSVAGLLEKFGGRKNVLATHPKNRTEPCVISRSLDVPKGGAKLLLEVANDPRGDCSLVVKIDGKEVKKVKVEGTKNATNAKWVSLEVDLADYAGKKISIELLNLANDWKWEGLYWSKIEVK